MDKQEAVGRWALQDAQEDAYVTWTKLEEVEKIIKALVKLSRLDSIILKEDMSPAYKYFDKHIKEKENKCN